MTIDHRPRGPLAGPTPAATRVFATRVFATPFPLPPLLLLSPSHRLLLISHSPPAELVALRPRAGRRAPRAGALERGLAPPPGCAMARRSDEQRRGGGGLRSCAPPARPRQNGLEPLQSCVVSRVESRERQAWSTLDFWHFCICPFVRQGSSRQTEMRDEGLALKAPNTKSGLRWHVCCLTRGHFLSTSCDFRHCSQCNEGAGSTRGPRKTLGLGTRRKPDNQQRPMCDLLCIGDRPRLLHGSGSLRLSLRLGQVPSAKCASVSWASARSRSATSSSSSANSKFEVGDSL